MRGPTLLLIMLLALPAGTLQAQRLTPSPFPTVTDSPTPPSPNPAALLVGRPRTHPALLAGGGVLGGAAGLVGGAIVGARATRDDCEDCFLLGGIYGAIAGGSAGLPLGVHVANGRRGRLLPSLAASLAIGGAGLGAAALTNRYEIMIPVPALQLLTSILIERSTSRRP